MYVRPLNFLTVLIALALASACTTMRPLRSYSGEPPAKDLERYAQTETTGQAASGFKPVPEYVTLPGPGDQSRAFLVRLVDEIDNTLLPLIGEAQRRADPTAPLQFDFSTLAGDLETVRAGIAAHLANPRTADPLTAVPRLRGYYSQ